MRTETEPFLEIEEPFSCDPGVVLGYLTGRLPHNPPLRIGPGARIRSGAIIYYGSSIGKGLETGHNVLIREENNIGDDFTVWSNSVIDYGCKIGNHVTVHCNVYVPQYTIIEDDVFIAPGCSFANDMHPGCPDFRQCMRGPVVERGAKIGVNVTILPKVRIGSFSLIGSGSVVTHDIPPYSVAYGNPARVTGHIGELICKTGMRDAPYMQFVTGNSLHRVEMKEGSITHDSVG